MKIFKSTRTIIALGCFITAPLSAQDLLTPLGPGSSLQISDILPGHVAQNKTLQIEFSELEQNSFVLEASFTQAGAEFDPIMITISDNEAFVMPSSDTITNMKQAFGEKSTGHLDFDYGNDMLCMGSKEELLSMCIIDEMLVSLQSDLQIGTQNTYDQIKEFMFEFQSKINDHMEKS